MFTVAAAGLSGPRLRSAETLTTLRQGVSQQRRSKANEPCPAEETWGGGHSCSETRRGTRMEKQRPLFQFSFYFLTVVSRLCRSLLCILIYFRQVAQQRVAGCEEARLSWHFLVFMFFLFFGG